MKTHCEQGHAFTKDNTYVAPKTGSRVCKKCRLEPKFGGNREAAILRDGEQCVMCGMTRDEHKQEYNRDITVDHIDNNGTHKPPHLRNNALDNLQTLCLECHAGKDNRQNKLTQDQVINIRHIGEELSHVALGKLYGVSRPYITMLMGRKWWKNYHA